MKVNVPLAVATKSQGTTRYCTDTGFAWCRLGQSPSDPAITGSSGQCEVTARVTYRKREASSVPQQGVRSMSVTPIPAHVRDCFVRGSNVLNSLLLSSRVYGACRGPPGDRTR
jgi:hypothetical protein